MAFWVSLLLWAGVTVFNRIFQPKAPKPQNAEPEAFQGITVEDGRPVPILAGTRQIKSANIGWYGDQSRTAILDGGITVGWKYYLGAQYPICIGPVDAIEDLRWNEKPIGTGISAATDGIVFGFGAGPYSTAHIAPGNYGVGEALALACENAMKATIPGNWKVTFGFTIVAGRNSRIVWGLRYSGVYRKRTAFIPAGSYTAAGLATAIQSAMQAVEDQVLPGDVPNEPAIVTCTYSSSRFQLRIDAAAGGGFGYEQWALFGADDPTFIYASTINSTIGYRMDISRVGVTTLAPDFDVLLTRFLFAYGGTTGKLKLTDAGFTAATILGFSTAADADLLERISDSDFAVIEATYTETTDYLQVDVNDPDFFGAEGGVVGRLDIFFGKRTQVASDYLTTQFGTQAPAWPGLCQIIERGMYIGNTNYPKPISVTPRKCMNELGLTLERHNIAGDSNPAAFLWWILTDPFWGLGKSESEIDRDAFIDVGNALAEEGLGVSFLIDALTPAEEIIDEVLRHIDGVRVDDPHTGLFTIRLIRNDYDVDAIPVMTRDNVRVASYRRRSWAETRNVVRVRYVDKDAEYQERIVELQNLANVQTRGGEVAIEEFSFPGLSRRATAEIVAQRLLKAVSHPPAELLIEANREFWHLRQGDPFLLTWAPLGVTAMACRVTRIRTGLLEDGRITIDAIEDLSGPAFTGFTAIAAPTVDEPEPDDLPAVVDASDAVLVGGMPMPGA